MKKILVIHPNDESTNFLKVIYEDLECDVITNNVSKKALKEAIKSHEKIIFLGQ